MTITIRNYRFDDLPEISKMFFNTVHCVNAIDYTPTQLFAWAKDENCLIKRREDLINQNTLIAEINGKIAGFGSIDGAACLDLLYVSKDYQRLGVATDLCDKLEIGFDCVKTYASITAKGFFQKRGYVVIKEQTVIRDGIALTNFEMKKCFDKLTKPK